jgi:hypothetical protein
MEETIRRLVELACRFLEEGRDIQRIIYLKGDLHGSMHCPVEPQTGTLPESYAFSGEGHGVHSKTFGSLNRGEQGVGDSHALRDNCRFAYVTRTSEGVGIGCH